MLGKILLFDRNVEMYFVSMEQSGTHWLRQMLAEYLLGYFDIEFRAENLGSYRKIIPELGDRFTPPVPGFPIIKHSHYRFFFKFRKQKVLLLVRDLKDASLSQWRKYCARNSKKISFYQFLKKPPSNELEGKHDLLRRINFLNSWGQADAHLYVVYYEDLVTNAEVILADVLTHLEIPVDRGLVQSVVEEGKLMKSHKLNINSVITNRNHLADRESIDRNSEKLFRKIVDSNLKENFGYDYK